MFLATFRRCRCLSSHNISQSRSFVWYSICLPVPCCFNSSPLIPPHQRPSAYSLPLHSTFVKLLSTAEKTSSQQYIWSNRYPFFFPPLVPDFLFFFLFLFPPDRQPWWDDWKAIHPPDRAHLLRDRQIRGRGGGSALGRRDVSGSISAACSVEAEQRSPGLSNLLRLPFLVGHRHLAGAITRDRWRHRVPPRNRQRVRDSLARCPVLPLSLCSSASSHFILFVWARLIESRETRARFEPFTFFFLLFLSLFFWWSFPRRLCPTALLLFGPESRLKSTVSLFHYLTVWKPSLSLISFATEATHILSALGKSRTL